MCASRMFTDPPQALREHYDRYLSWLRDAQILAGGDYNEFWQARDFLQSDSFDVSALIVQGLHDVVVHPKQFDLLRSSLLRCGCDVKCLLHQNGHVTPANEQTMTDILIGEHTYTELLNRWFTHYLLDADNGIDDMSAFTVQSNVDGSFYASESWNSGPVLELASGDPAGREYTVSAAGARLANQGLLTDTLDGSSGSDHLLLAAMRAEEDMTIAGVPQVRLRVRTKDVSHPFPMLAAVLIDTAEDPFPCYDVEWSEVLEQEILQENAVKAGHELQLYVIPYCGFSNDSAFYDSNTEEELRQLGFGPACMLPVTRDYSFTVDTQESRALIPLAR